MSSEERRVELVRVETRDGLFLDGALTVASPGNLPIDAFLLVHGTGSNFYAAGVLEEFAAHAVAAGVSVLRVNTRGHDGICTIPGSRGSAKGGATYEAVSDCRHDLAAWIAFLAARGLRRMALVGHSMGGVKAIYAVAHDPRPEVLALIGLSPPRFCFSNLQRHADFRSDYERATKLVAEGRPDELLAVTQPLPFLATAGGFVEKYGPSDRYDVARLLPRVGVPVLLFVGSESMANSPAFAGLSDSVRDAVGAGGNVSLRVIDGAGISYRGHLASLFTDVAKWLAILPNLQSFTEV